MIVLPYSDEQVLAQLRVTASTIEALLCQPMPCERNRAIARYALAHAQRHLGASPALPRELARACAPRQEG